MNKDFEWDFIDSCVTLVAKRKSGKSYLLRHIVKHYAHNYSKIFVCCPTEELRPFYSSFIPQNCIYDTYTEEWGEELLIRLKDANKGTAEKDMKRVLLILDDLVSDFDFHNSKSIETIYSRGRHLGITMVLTTQYLKNVSPLIRSNSDVIMVGQQNKASVSLLCEDFLSGDITKPEFIKLYNKNTVNFNFLMINCTSTKTGALDEIYAVIKAPIERENLDLRQINIPETEKNPSPPTTLWSSIFDEPDKKVRKTREKKEEFLPVKNILLQNIRGVKPIIRKAIFE